MTDVLGPAGEPRFALPRLQLDRGVRRVALAAAAVLGAAVLTVVHGVPPEPALLVAAGDLSRVDARGHAEPLSLPGTSAPARLLRLPHATVLLTRPAGRSSGGQALLLRDGDDTLRTLGPADTIAPDSRGDRVWLVRTGRGAQGLTSYDASGRRRDRRTVTTTHDLFLVTPQGVLDDEVGVPGGATPTLRDDAGRVLRTLPGPVTVLDTRGPMLLAVTGNCLQGCTVMAWDVRDGTTRSAPLDAGLVVLDGALSADGRSVALAGRAGSAGEPEVGTTGQAVLLRGPLDGGEPLARTVNGGCTLLACRVTFSGSTVWASVDRTPGRLVRWEAGRAPEAVTLRVPDVEDLSGL